LQITAIQSPMRFLLKLQVEFIKLMCHSF